MNKLCITIDGPSACGKSTTAKKVADALGIMHLDTGAIYRSIALWLQREGGIPQEEGEIRVALSSFAYEVKMEKGGKRHYVNGEDVTLAIRNNEISQLASKISSFPSIREEADKIQRKIAGDQSIVVDGRDAGTKVFPAADVKIFLQASREERAKRRLKELQDRGDPLLSLAEVEKEIEERDLRDKHRRCAPLKKPIGSTTIDTTTMDSREVVGKILSLVKEKEKEKKKSSSFWYKFVYGVSYGIFRFCYRIKVYGVENVPKGGAIIASNHVSYLDPVAIALASPEMIHFLAQEHLFRNPLFRVFLNAGHTHRISRTASNIQVMKETVDLLHQGNAVLIFPEGRRSEDGELAPLRPGVVLLATQSLKPVIPTYVKGPYEIWPRWKKFPRLFGRIEVFFGKPIYSTEYEKKGLSKKEAQEAFLEDLKEKIRVLLES